MSADYQFLRDSHPSGYLLWRTEMNCLGYYSVIDDRGVLIAALTDPVLADMIAAEHNAVTELESDNEAMKAVMNDDQNQTADLLIEYKAGLQEAKDLAKLILLECSKLSKNAPKLHTAAIQRLTKLSERRL